MSACHGLQGNRQTQVKGVETTGPPIAGPPPRTNDPEKDARHTGFFEGTLSSLFVVGEPKAPVWGVQRPALVKNHPHLASGSGTSTAARGSSCSIGTPNREKTWPLNDQRTGFWLVNKGKRKEALVGQNSGSRRKQPILGPPF